MSTTTPTLIRTVVETSRLMEFFSERELTMQLGFHRSLWPLALLKELLDNALDGCDSAGVLPQVTVTLTADALTVQDNGSGLPLSVLERSLDYSVRISDKAHYVSPSRGQLGNALKCLWGASYVAHGTQGRACVETNGLTYEVLVALDPLTQLPRCSCSPVGDGTVKSGTKITLHYPRIASYLTHTGWGDFYRVPDLLIRYAAFNPHASFCYTDPVGYARRYGPTQGLWPHWLPSYATSPHWYTAPRFEALLRAYLATDLQHGRVRTVRDVVAEFAGLSSTSKRKAVTEAAGLHGAPLTALLHGEALDADRARSLLRAMQAASKPIQPARLGILGEPHLHAVLTARCGVDPATVKYKCIKSADADVPFVLEVAFGGLEHDAESGGRELLLGINWSPALGTPFDALHTLLSEAMVEEEDPVAILVHLACPQVACSTVAKPALRFPMRSRRL
jgi:DNA topoisomerase VI subunit B